MHLTIFMTALFAGLVSCLRGGGLHNHLVLESERIFRDAGFETRQEHPEKLGDGRIDFVDLMVWRGEFRACVEIETSSRHVLDNASKARVLGLPLVVVVPSRKVHKAVKDKFKRAGINPKKHRIWILLLGQLEHGFVNCFPLIPSANSQWEDRKSNRRKD
jgi:hypothetical protein